MTTTDLCLYAVRNAAGLWFRAKGREGRGESWVEKFEQARIYQKIGPARATVSWFANARADLPIPDLVCLTVGEITVLDEQARVLKQRADKKERERQNRIRHLQWQINHMETRTTDHVDQLNNLRAELTALEQETP